MYLGLNEPEPVGRPCYLFRCVMPIAEFLSEVPRLNQAHLNLRRFFRDWGQVSAADD